MMRNQTLKFIILGVLFALTWSSSATSAKFGLRYAEPLVLYEFRFFVSGFLMLFLAIILKQKLKPSKTEWKQLSIFGFLNVSLYLGLFVLGINEVAAGIGTLATSINPLIMTVLSFFFIGRQIKAKDIIVLFLGMCGVGVALFPLFGTSYATIKGILFLALSMVSYSTAALYYSKLKWNLGRWAINGWQIILGGIFMLPITLFLHEKSTVYNTTFWLSVLWMAVVVSGIAVYLWLWLLQKDAVKASYFLFICPISGFLYASIILKEPFSIYTFIGLSIVIIALLLGQRK